jgi:hypothetical protein
MLERLRKCFAFAFATLCLMMVCTIPYDRLPEPNYRPTESTATITVRKEGSKEKRPALEA